MTWTGSGGTTIISYRGETFASSGNMYRALRLRAVHVWKNGNIPSMEEMMKESV
jgi:hypothetical protein